MDAIVTAGGTPQPEDLLYPFTQGEPKALLDICGKPMIQWVLDALSSAEMVDRVVVNGLPETSGIICSKVAAFIPDQGEMLDNIRAGARKILELNPAARHVLIVSSDIPAITAESVDWVVKTVMQTDDDVYYNVITRQAMESRYPDSRRSYVRLQDIEACGGDMNAARVSILTESHSFWDQIVASRKNAFKQAALIGYDTLVLLLLRKLTMDKAVQRVARRLNMTGRAIVCPYAEVGMDIDKPNQLEILRADLAKRMQPGAS
jgi:GTP:adenosylcobinamide-phosphate guanylyltransferase